MENTLTQSGCVNTDSHRQALTLAPPSSIKRILQRTFDYHDSQVVKSRGTYPYYRKLESPQEPIVHVDGRELIMLGSNNYLGLVSDPRVIGAAQQATGKYGTGCAGSRLLNGTIDLHERLESRLAVFVGKEAALLYATGFQANLGLIAGLAGRHDVVIIDKCNHASIVDGVRTSHAQCRRFRHNDVEHLRSILAGIDGNTGTLVVVDGVFSMEGDLAPQPALSRLCTEFGAAFMVDDAHGLGVMGKGGQGTASFFNTVGDVDIIMGTFSKSLGSIGGFIAGEAPLIEFLRHNSRAMMFSASMPPGSTAAALKSLEIIEEEPERIAKLWRNATFLRQAMQHAGFDTGDSCTPIIPLIVGDDGLAFRFCVKSQEKGVFVNPVPGLSLRPGGALIRLSVMSTHEEHQLERAAGILEKVGRELGIVNG